MEKYIGRIVDIIYQDRHGKFTKRQISVHSVRDGRVKGFDTAKQSFRVFDIDRILAVQPVSRHVG
ncbi:MAG: hypothetical protein P0Y55_14460 [Candidatus Cohnella colombiensis]|uniref:WYL domain-containing protein n=1 Tax=Candidatus Cohnella colombiensis TaxID=3121368 RepID=A0AA95J9Y2_9BACL|nr:MAG: hypothetical protein P0Y55_14460 [Cohnella sp.]